MFEYNPLFSQLIKLSVNEIEKQFKTLKKTEFVKYEIEDGAIYIVYNSKISYNDETVISYGFEEDGIILENNNQFSYYNFKQDYKNKKEIVKKFVEKYYSDS
ncbi:MAG: hypothetical protein HUK28_07165 [Methanobrevibacter sp.]|nr:hypothetical protein [Methanobrevibacter sp.]